MKVLLLTASYGDGHHQVASALADAFSVYGVETCEFDCIRGRRGAGAAARKAFWEWLYEAVTRYAPFLYGLSYQLTRHLDERHWLWRLLSLSLRQRVREALVTEHPDAVLQLFPERVLLDLGADVQKPWTGMVITDYSVHRRWFHSGVDAYFLPDQTVFQDAHPYVQEGALCRVSGIPLRRAFWPDGDGGQHREAAGSGQRVAPALSPERPYVLFATGGRGLFPDLKRIIASVTDVFPQHDVIVLCGRNERMKVQVEACARRLPQVKALSFVEDVASWYRQALFVVAKAGGITVSECLAARCPMLLYRPQPGQEADNARFAVAAGAARVARHWREAAATLGRYADPDSLEEMRAACARVSHPDAARAVAVAVVGSMTP